MSNTTKPTDAPAEEAASTPNLPGYIERVDSFEQSEAAARKAANSLFRKGKALNPVFIRPNFVTATLPGGKTLEVKGFDVVTFEKPAPPVAAPAEPTAPATA